MIRSSSRQAGTGVTPGSSATGGRYLPAAAGFARRSSRRSPTRSSVQPNASLRFACGSQSTISTRRPRSASIAPKLAVDVVFVTPPLWLANAITTAPPPAGRPTRQPRYLATRLHDRLYVCLHLGLYVRLHICLYVRLYSLRAQLASERSSWLLDNGSPLRHPPGPSTQPQPKDGRVGTRLVGEPVHRRDSSGRARTSVNRRTRRKASLAVESHRQRPRDGRSR